MDVRSELRRHSSSSGTSDELMQGVQNILQEKEYPDSSTINGNYGTVQSLRDMITTSVSTETSGDSLITAWTAQCGSAEDVCVGYQSFVHFLKEGSSDAHKNELEQFVLYPLFVNCYIVLISMNRHKEAQELYSLNEEAITKQCTANNELKDILSLTTPSSIAMSTISEKYRNNKYLVRLSEPSYSMLATFLQAQRTPVLMNIMQKYFAMEVYGSAMQFNGEQKIEAKKGPSFYKPKIPAIPEYELFQNRPRPYNPPTTPYPRDTSAQTAARKAEFQQKLTAAAQQLNPAPPSVLLVSIESSNNWVQCSSLSAQRKLCAFGCEDSSIRLCTWSTKVEDSHIDENSVNILRGHRGAVQGVDFCNSGKYLLSCSSDCSVRLWDAVTHQCHVVYDGHSYPVWDIAFSPVDSYFITASYDNTARLWNTEYIYPLRIFAGHESSVDVARCHPNGNYVVTGSTDKTCRLWDINNGACVRLFTGSKDVITTLAFSPFGKQFASASKDGTVSIWDVGSCRIIHEIKGHPHGVTALSYSSDGTLLASSGYDGFIKLWNMKTILAPSVSSSSQELITKVPTTTTLPLSLHFTHRNCLVALGSICNYNNNYHGN